MMVPGTLYLAFLNTIDLPTYCIFFCHSVGEKQQLNILQIKEFKQTEFYSVEASVGGEDSLVETQKPLNGQGGVEDSPFA